MANMESMKRDLLTEMADDHVGLWTVRGYVGDEMPGADEAALRKKTLDVLYDMLRSGAIEAGFPDSNGRDFHRWPFAPEVVIDYIKARWKPHGPPPKPGEIAWFTTPTRAFQAARSP